MTVMVAATHGRRRGALPPPDMASFERLARYRRFPIVWRQVDACRTMLADPKPVEAPSQA